MLRTISRLLLPGTTPPRATSRLVSNYAANYQPLSAGVASDCPDDQPPSIFINKLWLFSPEFEIVDESGTTRYPISPIDEPPGYTVVQKEWPPSFDFSKDGIYAMVPLLAKVNGYNKAARVTTVTIVGGPRGGICMESLIDETRAASNIFVPHTAIDPSSVIKGGFVKKSGMYLQLKGYRGIPGPGITISPWPGLPMLVRRLFATEWKQ